MNIESKSLTTQPRLPAELLASSVFLLKKLGFVAKERAHDAYSEAGLTPYHHGVLAVLDEGSRETQGAIADALGYDRGQLVGLLDELEEHGLVERRRDPADRRRHIVQLTPSGRAELTELRRVAGEVDDEFLEGLSASERAQLQTILRKLAEEHVPSCAIGSLAALPPVPSV